VSRPRRLSSAIAAALAVLAFLLLAIAPAEAEQSGRDGILTSFYASFSPNILSRRDVQPVTISLAGGVRAGDGTTPRLGRIELAFATQGHLDATGLPACPRSRLRNATLRQALTRCRPALVGHGWIHAEVPLAPATPLVARARALAFNARKDGRTAVWLYAYSPSPPVSFVLPFAVRQHQRGAYGLVLEAPVAPTLGRWPRLRSFRITLGRRYSRNGEQHSFLSARCPLPPQLQSLTVPIARVSYRFAPGPTINTTILRSCSARD